MKDESDTETYKAIVLNCVLYVKVAKMSDQIFKELETSFAKQPILYQFRKFIAKEITVPVLSREFVTGNLFPDSEIPCKLHFVLVDTNALCGDQKKNPFQFHRKFKIKKEENELAGNLAVEINQTCMYEKLKDMHKQNRNLQVQLVEALSQIRQTFLEHTTGQVPVATGNLRHKIKNFLLLQPAEKKLMPYSWKMHPKSQWLRMMFFNLFWKM